MRSDKDSLVDKSKLCFFRKVDLSTDHFIKLIGERVQDCEAWEKKLRSQGEFKDAERMRRTKEQMLKSLKRLNGINQGAISKTFDLMQERSDAPKLTPEQLNAVDLLSLGKTDKEVSETIGVRRETVTRWHKNAFFYR